MNLVRRATVADAALLADLNAHVHDLHVAAAPDRYKPTVRAEVVAHYARELGRDEVAAWIAMEGDTAVGYVVTVLLIRSPSAFTPPARWLMVDQIAVAADARRGGHGRALMAVAEEHARGLGCERVVLDVAAFNAGARAFYEGLGFEPQGLRYGRALG